MSLEDLERWFADTEQRLQRRDIRVEWFRRDVEGMDPDVVLTLESDAVFATVHVWSVAPEAELHATSIATGEDLLLNRVKVDSHQLDGLFSPVLALFWTLSVTHSGGPNGSPRLSASSQALHSPG